MLGHLDRFIWRRVDRPYCRRRGTCATDNGVARTPAESKLRLTPTSGWRSVQPYTEITVEGLSLVLCHYPFRTWRGMAKGWLNLHGHCHGRLKPQPRQFDVGVDVWEFRPVTLRTILDGAPLRRTSGPVSSVTSTSTVNPSSSDGKPVQVPET